MLIGGCRTLLRKSTMFPERPKRPTVAATEVIFHDSQTAQLAREGDKYDPRSCGRPLKHTCHKVCRVLPLGSRFSMVDASSFGNSLQAIIADK